MIGYVLCLYHSSPAIDAPITIFITLYHYESDIIIYTNLYYSRLRVFDLDRVRVRPVLPATRYTYALHYNSPCAMIVVIIITCTCAFLYTIHSSPC